MLLLIRNVERQGLLALFSVSINLPVTDGGYTVYPKITFLLITTKVDLIWPYASMTFSNTLLPLFIYKGHACVFHFLDFVPVFYKQLRFSQFS